MNVSVRRRRWGFAIFAATALIAASCGARVAPYFPVSAGAGSATSTGNALGPSTGTGALGCVGSSTTTKSKSASKTKSKSAAKKAATAPGTGCSNGGLAIAGTAGHTITIGGSAGANGSRGGTSAGAAGSNVAAAALNPQNFSLNPAQEAAYCTGTAGNTSSAPGVTPNSILLGNVSGETGLIQNSFDPGWQAVTALFDSINRFGGICGRQLKLKVEDDQQSASTNQSDVQDLIPQVLAFVGSLSDADNGGVAAMVQANVPDLGPAINTNRSNSPVYWSATGGSVTVRNGRAYLSTVGLNGERQYNDLPHSLAILSYAIPISQQAAQEYETLYKQAGVNICFTDFNVNLSPQGSMPSDVQSMHSKGCDSVFTTLDISGNAALLQDIQNDGYKSEFKNVSVTYEGYTPEQISSAGEQAAQGLQVALSSVPLSEPNPAVQLYTQEINTFEPGTSATEFGLEAWADAQLFVYALLKGGRNPTRASLTAALNAVTNWTLDGAFGSYTPHNRTGPTCAMQVQVRGNTFVRLWPQSGLYCNGQLVDVGSAG